MPKWKWLLLATSLELGLGQLLGNNILRDFSVKSYKIVEFYLFY
jgi:hypothetical protein